MHGMLTRFFILVVIALLVMSGSLPPGTLPQPVQAGFSQPAFFSTPNDAFQAAMDGYNTRNSAAYSIVLSDQSDALAYASAVDSANAEKFLVLLAVEETGQGWAVLIPGESPAPEYNRLLNTFPEALIDEVTKAFLRQPEQSDISAQSLLLANYTSHKLPWPYGISAYVTQKDTSYHMYQIDFDIQGLAASGQVVATRPGTVAFVKESSNTTCSTPAPDPCWKKSNMVVIQHDSGEYSWYVHLAYNSVPVTVGQYVDYGTVIGIEGRTGYSTGIHLHYMASSGHYSWTDPNDPNNAPWATGITAVDFAEYSWDNLVYTYSYTYLSQNASNLPMPCPGAGGVLLYRNSQYACSSQFENSGYVLRTVPGFENLPDSFNNSASSLRVPTGKSVLLYEDAERSGGKKCYNAPGDEDFTGDVFDNSVLLENQVSSFEFFSAPDCPVGQEDPIEEIVDNLAPQISIPAPNGYLTGGSVTVEALATDTISGISHVQFFAGYNDGSGWAWHNLGYDLSCEGDAWRTTWVPGAIPDQSSVAFFVYTWDGAGNGNGRRSTDFSLDRTPPTAMLTNPASSQDSTRFLVQWAVSDNLTGPDAWDIQYQVDGSSTWQDWLMNQTGSTRSAWFTGLMGHTYAFRIRARDLAGNQGSYATTTSTLINTCNPNDYEPDGDKEHARSIQPEAAAEIHKICGAGDVDWFSFPPNPDTTYIINTNQPGPTTDTALSVFRADGSTIVAENGSAGGGQIAFVLAPPTSDSILYIRVRHTDAQVAGDAVTYNLTVAPVRAVIQLPAIYR